MWDVIVDTTRSKSLVLLKTPLLIEKFKVNWEISLSLSLSLSLKVRPSPNFVKPSNNKHSSFLTQVGLIKLDFESVKFGPNQLRIKKQSVLKMNCKTYDPIKLFYGVVQPNMTFFFFFQMLKITILIINENKTWQYCLCFLLNKNKKKKKNLK